MSRRRHISTDISLDEALDAIAHVSDFAALLYTWMIPHASDDATITGVSRTLKALVIPHREDRSVEDVTEALDLMESHGLFELRTPKTIYFAPETFYKYQSYVSAKNRRSEGALDVERRKSPEITGNHRKSPEITASLSLSLSPSLSPSPSKDKTLSSSRGESYPQADPALGYFEGKVGREVTVAERTTLRKLVKKYGAGCVELAIGQAAVQGDVENMALVTTIAKSEAGVSA